MPAQPARRLSGNSSPPRPLNTASLPSNASITRRMVSTGPSPFSSTKLPQRALSSLIDSGPSPTPMYSGAFCIAHGSCTRSITRAKKSAYHSSGMPRSGGGCRITQLAPWPVAQLTNSDCASHGGLGDRHRHGYRAGDLIDHPLHQLTLLLRGKLVNLSSQAEHGDAVSTPAQARAHLAPHRFTVERPGTREERVHHRIDAGERSESGHSRMQCGDEHAAGWVSSYGQSSTISTAARSEPGKGLLNSHGRVASSLDACTASPPR